jgi:hypothetical protein
VHEHIFATVIANDEAEALLRIEEFYDAFAFADDLRRHSTTTAGSAAAESTAAAATAESVTAAAESTAASTVAESAAAAAEPVTAAAISTATAAAATESVTATAGETSAIAVAAAFTTTEKIVAFVTAATTAVPLTPSIETHIRLKSLCPQTFRTNALGPKSATGHMRDCSHTIQFPTAKKRVSPVIPARLRGMGLRSAARGVLWGQSDMRRTSSGTIE